MTGLRDASAASLAKIMEGLGAEASDERTRRVARHVSEVLHASTLPLDGAALSAPACASHLDAISAITSEMDNVSTAPSLGVCDRGVLSSLIQRMLERASSESSAPHDGNGIAAAAAAADAADAADAHLLPASRAPAPPRAALQRASSGAAASRGGRPRDSADTTRRGGGDDRDLEYGDDDSLP